MGNGTVKPARTASAVSTTGFAGPLTSGRPREAHDSRAAISHVMLRAANMAYTSVEHAEERRGE